MSKVVTLIGVISLGVGVALAVGSTSSKPAANYKIPEKGPVGGHAAQSAYHLLKIYRYGPAVGATSEYFDYITVDSAARRVYFGRGTEVQVIDADNGKLLGRITGLKRQHGVAIARELNRGFITDGRPGTLTIFNLRTLKIIRTVTAQPDADCVVYDPVSQRVFTMNGDPNSSTVFDARTGNVINTIPLGGAPEFAVADGRACSTPILPAPTRSSPSTPAR